MKIRVLLSGRGYDVAENLPREVDLPEGATLDQALSAVDAQLPQQRRLPGACLIAISGQHVGNVARHTNRALRDGEELVLIAPVAGG
jgi:molybdopterin converting factor small subunit